MASSSSNWTEQYPYPCQVNPSGFVSIKLSGNTDYDPWREQMRCLIESHGMQGFIDGTFKTPGQKDEAANYEDWKRSDTLVKGWMFGSLTKRVMATVVGLHTAMDVWNKLNTTYNTPPMATVASTTIKRKANDVWIKLNTTYTTPPMAVVASTTAATTNKGKDLAEYIPLHRAILAGDWETAREHFNEDNNALTAKLTEDGNRALHIAIEATENIEFVKNLLREMNVDSLPSMVTDLGLNPLHYAAIVGNTAAAKLLVEQNPHLLFVLDLQNFLPIHRAVFSPRKLTFFYMLAACKKHIRLSHQDGYHGPFDGKNGALLLVSLIRQGILDVAYELIKEYPDMVRTEYKDFNSPLINIANNRDFYYSGSQYNVYQRFVYSYVTIDNTVGNSYKVQDIENQEAYRDMIVSRCRRSWLHTGLLWTLHIKRIKEDKVKHQIAQMLLRRLCEEIDKSKRYIDISYHFLNASCVAALNDTPEAIEEMVMHFPQAIWSNSNGHYIIQLAIIHRAENVYNLLVHKMNINMFIHKAMKDNNGNNLLHLAAQLAPIHKLNVISGAALQMQRELQWFEEVEKFVGHEYKEAKNKKQETPMMMFRREHKELRKEGEEWMKKTADSYTITAVLIVTIVFAAAITVPGGNNSDTGKALYLRRPSFIVFAVSDAISLFTSTTSLLLFLSILTARYRDEDFLYRLPKRLILGLVMLFLSVTSLMVAFSATLYIVSGQENQYLIPIAVLTCLPIASFVTLQFPLLVELVSSTYGGGIFGKQK